MATEPPNSALFHDSASKPSKFFLQQTLPDEIKAQLTETILSHGGTVLSKVPNRGYILTDPNTDEEDRLRLCWMINRGERPERFLVPYTFVDACKAKGEMIPMLFGNEGVMLKFWIHPGIANVNARVALSTRIRHSGGLVVPKEEDASVIIADINSSAFERLVTKYEKESDKHVESHLWVKQCVERKDLEFTPVAHHDRGGRKAGELRNSFTREEDRLLCEYIAKRIPQKESGGRTGNKIYQDLVALGDEKDEYSWAKSHSWQSWRERYKKNADRLDLTISKIVQQKDIKRGEPGQLGYRRDPTFKDMMTVWKPTGDTTLPQLAPIEEHGQVGMRQTLKKRPRRPTSPLPSPPTSPAVSTAASEPQAVVHLKATSEKRSPRGENPSQPSTDAPTQYDDDESGWRVRIGKDPPPLWAQRPPDKQIDAQGEKERPAKRQRKGLAVSSFVLLRKKSAHFKNNSAAATHIDPNLVKIDLENIATKYRFTLKEVHDFYDTCKDMEKTKSRFKKIRQMIKEQFPVE
ncbi:hypothetical protein DL96DRAFT_1666083 [Flagelloscypha sp. PMI_526]|nr:hypothetical protein DL96DRAFT_1666083 [Flagelloscypha sp. PMI_526]